MSNPERRRRRLAPFTTAVLEVARPVLRIGTEGLKLIWSWP
jgi:hypothetical protein